MKTARIVGFALTLSFAELATTQEAFADVPAGATEYTIQKGDTCAGVAARHYGDARRVDLIHSGNPNMGPSPHRLVEGTTLVLPPKPPDARLTRARNIVEVRAPEPRPGKPNDPLFRGNRVGTKENSTAEVTFRDDTQVKLGENTLVVILGDANARAARLSALETTLVTGSLRARLSELTGKGKPTEERPSIATASGAVKLKDGEAQVTVDDAKTTRLAVYKGSSSLTAQRKVVDVADGFGSKAETGRVPTPPKPLPPAPEWAKNTAALVVTTSPTADLLLAFGVGVAADGVPSAAQWHVQLARDAAFDDILVDTRTPLETRTIETKNATVGTYYARASAVDADAFEGKWSATAAVTVATLSSTPLPSRRTRIDVKPDEVRCSIGDALQAQTFELDRSAFQSIACKLQQSNDPAVAVAMPALPLGPVRAIAELVGRDHRTGTVVVRITDEAGAPVRNVQVMAEGAGPGMLLGALTPLEAPGSYRAAVTFDPSSSGGALRLRVNGAPVETNVVAVAPEPTPAPPAPEHAHVELLASGRVMRVLEEGFGFGGGLGARLALPTTGGDVLIGVQGIFEAVPPTRSDVAGLGRTRVRADIWGVSLPIGYRLGGPKATLAPYLLLGPQLLGTRGRIGPASADVPTQSITPGLGAAIGAELRLHDRGAAFLELNGRAMVPGEGKGPQINASAAGLSLGYRFQL